MSGSSSSEPKVPVREIIAGWEIGDQLGEGAFGVVFKVTQSKPVNRTGAMKILRPTMGSKETLARFEAERQALALINHEGVVTIFDAGTTDDGRPFYVMEFVDGEPVNKFAADFSLNEKLALFDQICSVVAHAHLCGIIHRDLKPANILIGKNSDSSPQVKLLDFGIAKATETVLTDKTLMTSEGQMLGTPEYMSPEQAGGIEVDTRSDVYSLGVIFFELLAGRTPFILNGNSLSSVVNFLSAVREDKAPKPSDFSAEPIPPDLEWIAATAIEQNTERRYQSVRELQDDLRRFTENQPVVARPPDQIYVLKKFLRRHWKAVSVAAALALTVSGAAVVSSLMAIKANEASQETASAYSRSKLDSAVRLLDENRILESKNSLRLALEFSPSNIEAKRLLNSIIEHFPDANLANDSTLHDRGVNQCHILDNDGTAVYLTEDGNLKWNDDSKVIRVGGSHHNSFAVSNQGILAAGNLQGGVSLVDLKQRNMHAENLFPENRAQFTAFEFSKNGKLFFATTWKYEMAAWSSESGDLLWKITTEGRPLSLIHNPDGSSIVVGMQNGTLEKRNSETGEKIGKTVRLTGKILNLQLLGEKEFLAFQETGFVTRFDFKTLSPRRTRMSWNGELETVVTRSTDSSNTAASPASPPPITHAIGTDSGVFLWSAESASPIRFSTKSPVTKIAFHPTRKIIAVGTESSGVQLFNWFENRLIAADITAADTPVSLSFSEDSDQLFIATRRGRYLIYNVPPPRSSAGLSSGDSLLIPDSFLKIPREVRDFEFSDVNEIAWPKNLTNSTPISAAFAKSRLVASLRQSDAGLFVWDTKTGDLIRKLLPEGQPYIRCCAISDDAKWLAFASSYGEIEIIDIDSGEKKPFVLPHNRSITSIAIDSANGKVATATYDCCVRIFELETGKLVAGPMWHENFGDLTQHYCRFSQNGMRLVSWGQNDNLFRVWNSSTGQPLSEGMKMPGKTRFAQFHPQSDDHLITVSESENGSYFARIWAVESGVPVTPILNFSHCPSANELPLIGPN